MRFSNLTAYLTAGAVGVSAAPVIEARGVIAHDAVVGFPQTVPSDLKFQPFLKVENGCVPFPAVDASGNTGYNASSSGGLNPSGGSSSQCDKNTGQVYARGAEFGSRYGIMYSWYMPKDSPSTGFGHRHDWEGVVVWIDNPNTSSNPQVLAVSTSGHGKWDTITSNLPLDGTRPKIRYYSVWPVNHQLGTTDTKGGEQPLVAWESLPEAARAALQNTDFGDANVPFKDPNFMDNLQGASF
ncbi:NPP1 domain protein [Apiospora marii]|uniref:NPP1 domain protein n=1 Tax=Apiospora marii TaxID=335849 RepID=A0ABR1S5B9_9PEZI